MLFSFAFGLFVGGLATGLLPMIYVSIGISVCGIATAFYIYFKHRNQDNHVGNTVIYVYKDPNMKRNKSETNLDLIQTNKNVETVIS